VAEVATLRAILTAPSSARVGEVVEVRALAQHPMETGYRRSSEGEFLPRDLVRRVECHFEGELVFAADLHAAIAANPYVAFYLKLASSGSLTVRWQGDRGVAHSETLRITAT
jgi:sulfur-oxidizing protein SoxZ